jgi:hypothetical protein
MEDVILKYKVSKCEKSLNDCKNRDQCIYYHDYTDRRRPVFDSNRKLVYSEHFCERDSCK